MSHTNNINSFKTHKFIHKYIYTRHTKIDAQNWYCSTIVSQTRKGVHIKWPKGWILALVIVLSKHRRLWMSIRSRITQSFSLFTFIWLVFFTQASLINDSSVYTFSERRRGGKEAKVILHIYMWMKKGILNLQKKKRDMEE